MFKSKNLLSVSTDAKTIKGEKLGVMTGILYLAPHNLSGYQVCPKASDECKLACLYSAGRGGFNSVQTARLNKTKYFFESRAEFMATLVKNIESLIVKATKANMVTAIRLNGTSDIGWEKIACIRNGVRYDSVMEAFTDIQFYDYTKIIGRNKAIALPNYHLTFSLSENNDIEAIMAISSGYNVAVVIKNGLNEAKPSTWSNFNAIDGDESDVRFYDDKNSIVLLRAKGKARAMATKGFIRESNGKFNLSNIKHFLAA